MVRASAWICGDAHSPSFDFFPTIESLGLPGPGCGKQGQHPMVKGSAIDILGYPKIKNKKLLRR